MIFHTLRCGVILAPNIPTLKVIILSQMQFMGEVWVATLTNTGAYYRPFCRCACSSSPRFPVHSVLFVMATTSFSK